MDAPEPTLREARRHYFEENGFGPDGGYGERWVKVKLGPLPLAFPNSAGRVRAVRYHDLHHVLTDYATDWVGEAEIGAWEVASSCRGFLAAWVLNLLAVPVGALLDPRAVYRAFIRGRHTRNLYAAPFDEDLLDAGVDATRRHLGLDAPRYVATARDHLALGGWALVAAALQLAMALLLFGPIAIAISLAR
jgi:hypothetical protein